MGKKLNSVHVFFDEAEFESLAGEAYADDRTPAEFLRRLFRLHMRKKIAEHSQACEDKQRELDASDRNRATPNLGGVVDFTPRERKSGPVQFTSGFQDTQSTGDE
jgi:hypothetical protein